MLRRLGPCCALVALAFGLVIAQATPPSVAQDGMGGMGFEAEDEVVSFRLRPFSTSEVGEALTKHDVGTQSQSVEVGMGGTTFRSTEVATTTVEETLSVLLEVGDGYLVVAETYETASEETVTEMEAMDPRSGRAMPEETTTEESEEYEGHTIVKQLFVEEGDTVIINDDLELDADTLQSLIDNDRIMWWMVEQAWILDTPIDMPEDLLSEQYSDDDDGAVVSSAEGSTTLVHLGAHDGYEGFDSVAVFETSMTLTFSARGMEVELELTGLQVFDAVNHVPVHMEMEGVGEFDSEIDSGMGRMNVAGSITMESTSDWELTSVTDEELLALVEENPYTLVSDREDDDEDED